VARPSKLTVEVVTGERVVFQADNVDMVVAPGAEGQLGILPRHAPLFTLLSLGEMRIKQGASEQALVVFGGFLEVNNNRVLVLADSAERVEEVDTQRAESARQRAQTRLSERAGTAEDLARAELALRRASVRLRVAQRQRGGRGRPAPGSGTSEMG
jgi:F-type H+-transporting ATPase subunit epsilon